MNTMSTPPTVWFQDLTCRWHYITDSFTSYVRLMMIHCGLPHWQYVFTPSKVPPRSEQWLRHFLPERTALGKNIV